MMDDIIINCNHYIIQESMNLSTVTDEQLRYYIQTIFMRYDRDNSGGLDAA